MGTRIITLTLDKAKEWYNSNNKALKEAALQAYTEEELNPFDFRNVKTFSDAVNALYPEKSLFLYFLLSNMETTSKASAASFKLNIIRKALNKGYDISFAKGKIWYPYNPILCNNSFYKVSENESEVAKVIIKDKIYTLMGGDTNHGSGAGLGNFDSVNGVGDSWANFGFLGCATKEIAEHFGRYFAKEIFEAKYGDLIDYKWID